MKRLAAPLAAISTLKISPSGVSTVKKGRARAGGTVSYRLNVAAKVRFTIQRRGSGRRVKHAKTTTCDRSSKSNRAKPSCTRYTTLTGSFSQSGKAGANSVRFTGRLNGRRLARGRYRLVAAPTANGRAGHTATVAFRVVR